MDNRINSKNLITIACIVGTIVTSGIIICTILTMYQFKNLGQFFNSYHAMQLSGSITMFLWGLRFLLYYKGKQRYLYSIISFFISIGLIFFLNKL